MEKFSMLSDKTDEELEAIHVELTEKYGNDLQDDSIPSEKRKLSILAAKKVSPDKINEEIRYVHEFVLEHTYRKLKDIPLINYLALQKKDDFGVYGEQRISISLCRIEMGIPNNREVNQFDADRFRRKLSECDNRYGNKTGEEYQEYLNNARLIMFPKENSTMGFNELFERMECNYYLYFTSMNHFIFGMAEKSRIGNKNIYLITKEYCRSPSQILSVAGRAIKDGMIIRREALEVIFFNKWEKFYNISKAERKLALRHVDSNIRDGLKEKTLLLYKAANTHDVKKIRDMFVSDMDDGVKWHEIGHLINHTDMNRVQSAFRSSDIFPGDGHIGHVLFEIMADYASARDGEQGAMARFAEISETDIERATRCYFTYMSDNFFLDEDEEDFMRLMTNAIVSIAYYFVNPDGSVNFLKLKNEYKQVYETTLNIYKKLCDEQADVIRFAQYEVDSQNLNYTDLVREILDMITSKKYDKPGHIFKYSFLEKKIGEEYQNNNVSSEDLPKLETWFEFWDLLIPYLKKYSKTGWEQSKQKLLEASISLEQIILNDIIKVKGKFNSLHDYITARSEEIGILKKQHEINISATINKVCGKIRMPATARYYVENEFAKIFADKKYEISIDYNGEKSPFITALQEMMLESGYGEIKAGMLIGEDFNSEINKYLLIKNIEDELVILRDQINFDFYSEIDTLCVNKKYLNLKQEIKLLLKQITFSKGQTLAQKIKAVEFTPMNKDALFEVFIPLKKGFMDWNTAQAVWRINQDLRPDEFLLQWTIDKTFLEALVEAYC